VFSVSPATYAAGRRIRTVVGDISPHDVPLPPMSVRLFPMVLNPSLTVTSAQNGPHQRPVRFDHV